MAFVDFRYVKLNLTELVTHMLLFWTCMQSTNQQNEFGSEISDKDDIGAGSAECVVDERVEVDNDEGLEICDANR